jgi:hypothetical protein
MNLCKLEYSEAADGRANEVGMKVAQWVLEVGRRTYGPARRRRESTMSPSPLRQVMTKFPKYEAIQGWSLAVLVQLSDNYALRKSLMGEDWVGRAVAVSHRRTVKRARSILCC